MFLRFTALATPLFFIASQAMGGAVVPEMVQRYCADCHDSESKKGSLDLASIRSEDPGQHPAIWERVIRQLNARQMPPIGKKRPSDAGFDAAVAALTGVLDKQAADHPMPGRTDTLRRLNRTEYQNVIRDLLAVEIDAKALLPADESSHGFDNVTVGDLPPALLQRYITAAQKISRMAVGAAAKQPDGDTIRVRPDITQEDHIEGLPLGTRGGVLIPHTFPQDGEYEVQVRLMRDRNEFVEGLSGAHQLEVLLDRAVMNSFEVKPPASDAKDHSKVDAHLRARFAVTAGRHDLGVTFVKNPASVLERLRQPYKASFNLHRHPRLSPAVYQVSILGPFNATGPGDTESRRRLFIAYPKTVEEEEGCARQVLGSVMRRAFRRPISDTDLAKTMAFYFDARRESNFEGGIEAALSAILLSHEFLFRKESDPAGLAPRTAYQISGLEMASRLSFFLWSSIPDDALLEAAGRGELQRPETLEKQVRRMLADQRSRSLVTSFAEQWLYLRNLDSITPDGRLFPDFDDNLRQALRQETSLLFDSILREDRSVCDLLKTDHTWLNQRLAQHYGIPQIYGERFREVKLEAGSERGGLLRHGSILTVTSYATRTSPVLRGHWILKNLLGTPPPPPPPNVPALKDNTVAASLPVRDRLAAHRANAACANCHNIMDPVGFALEHFDAVGRWRDIEEGKPVDASGGLPDGSTFNGVDGLEKALLKRPELFVTALTEKLLTFALGRGVESSDAPAIREIVRRSGGKDFRFSEIIVSIAASPPFRMRTTP